MQRDIEQLLRSSGVVILGGTVKKHMNRSETALSVHKPAPIALVSKQQTAVRVAVSGLEVSSFHLLHAFKSVDKVLCR